MTDTQQPVAEVKPPKGVYGAAVLLGLWMLVPPLLGFYLLSQIEPLTGWFRQDLLMGAVWFALGYMVCCGLGILPTYAPSIVCGWIFPPWIAFPTCVLGYFGASTIGYIISRLASGQHDVERWIDHWPKAKVIRHALVEEQPRRTLLIVGLLRLSPSCPFSITNLAMATSGVRFPVFIVGTVLGMAPRTLAAVLVSHWAAEQGAKDLVQLATQQGWVAVSIGVVLLVGSLMLIGHIAQQALTRAVGAKKPPIR